MTTPAQEDVRVLSTEVGGFVGTAWLINIQGQHFVISAAGGETRAFDANALGEVESWSERVGVDRDDHEACIASLLKILARRGGAS